MKTVLLLGIAFAGIVGALIALAHANRDDNGSVSATWLADEKGKRDQ